MSATFTLRPIDEARAQDVARALRLPTFVARTLVARGIATPEDAERFLNPDLDRDWENPYDLPGLAEVADLLEEAIEKRQRVVVFGDFDLDGISATAVLTRGLRALGGLAIPFIPRRFEEGYGLSAAAFERVRALEPDVIVTVDCGIACRDEVKAIVKAGVAVAITDHHEISDAVPVDVPVADPKLDEGCPSAILAGVGVALKLVQMLGGRAGYPHLWRSYTDLAALGTVADLMPLVRENRALVADGIKAINNHPRPCIQALLSQISTLDPTTPLTSTTLSFTIIPRLNAAGRLGDAELALDLLMSDSFEEASELAERLETMNDERRRIEVELASVAEAQAERDYAGERALVVAGEGWHEGVKGIVASRLVDRYGVPTLLFAIDGDEARGSGRSVGSVNLFEAVESLRDLLTRFGGHEAAVGVTLPKANLEEFRRGLCAYMDALPSEAFRPKIVIDTEVELGELRLGSVRTLETLAPFGQENPVPLFLGRHLLMESARAVGTEKNHLSCTLTDGMAAVGAIMFHCPNIEGLLETQSVVDAVFSLQIDTWRGRQSVKAMLKAIEPGLALAGTEEISPFATATAQAATAESATPLSDEDLAACRERWRARALADPEGLEAALASALIGDHTLHESQRQTLAALRAGHSVMTVMATGRGKSLIFQIFAAELALTQNKTSLFVFPLRALLNDQLFHMEEALRRFGLRTVALSGATPLDARDELWRRFDAGAIDIVLTTPEFLSFHADRFARAGRVGFVVIDEAHHIGQARAGARPAYRSLRETLALLGDPILLALTATAPRQHADAIAETLRGGVRVIDDTARENLQIVDQRANRRREEYLAHLIATGAKTLIYVNSRDATIDLVRRLRARVPQFAERIGFYNAGLTRAERARAEELFRDGTLVALVATSAFGEGVDLPDVRHLVLYHLPYNEVEFNQMSGRGGRDGAPAWIHLLFGGGDAAINRAILAAQTPNHDAMAQIYRCLRTLARKAPGGFSLTLDELAETASGLISAVEPASCACALQVFEELGLIQVRREPKPPMRAALSASLSAINIATEGQKLTITVKSDASRVELTDSDRYCEGLDETASFEEFCSWILNCDPYTLNEALRHPITPDNDRLSGRDGEL